jgi:hypothetical protein
MKRPFASTRTVRSGVAGSSSVRRHGWSSREEGNARGMDRLPPETRAENSAPLLEGNSRLAPARGMP